MCWGGGGRVEGHGGHGGGQVLQQLLLLSLPGEAEVRHFVLGRDVTSGNRSPMTSGLKNRKVKLQEADQLWLKATPVTWKVTSSWVRSL